MPEANYTEIFFFITSVAVVVVTIFISFAAYYVMKAAGEFRSLISLYRSRTEDLADELRRVRRTGAGVWLIARLLKMIFRR